MALRTNERPTLDPDSETLSYSEHAPPRVAIRGEDDDDEQSSKDPPSTDPPDPDGGDPGPPPVVDGINRSPLER